jgi:Domain of unknown function (DUF6456)
MKQSEGVNPADLIGDALRVLKRLAAPGTRLVWRSNYYALTGTGRAGRALQVQPPMVDAMRRRDWLVGERNGDFVLSEVGLGWLRRAMESDDPFSAQHRDLAGGETPRADGTHALVTINEAESPLTRLHVQRDAQGVPLIDETQLMAGERLRRDFTLAQLEPRMAVDLTAPVVAGRRGANHDELSDIAVAARQRFSRALAMLGPGLSDIAIDVCCHLKELKKAQSAQGWPDSAALVVFKLALDRLAVHYGLVVTGAGRRTRAWCAAAENDAQMDSAEGKKTARDPGA